MAKEKSLKLRTIISICTLYKHSDKNHRLTPGKMNSFLKPYDLRITGVGLSDDVRIMQEFGLDAHTNEGEQAHSAYIGDPLISDEILKKLIFAVSTNPYISQTQATDILQQFKPLVTIYQEPILKSFLKRHRQPELDDSLYWTYLVMKEAIDANRRVLYTVDYAKYNREKMTVETRREWETMFTPIQLMKSNKQLYALGYNNTDSRIEYLDLAKLATIRLSQEYKGKTTLVQAQKEGMCKNCTLQSDDPVVLYEGPAVFRCYVSNIPVLYELFGEPTGRVEQTYNFRTTYRVEHAIITTEVISRLSELSQNDGVQITGPYLLQNAVSNYLASLGREILSKKFLRNRNGNSNSSG